MTIGNIDVKFRGRDIKIAGDRTIDAWTVTAYNDTNFRLKMRLKDGRTVLTI